MHRLCSHELIHLLYVCVKMPLWECWHVHTVWADMTVLRSWTLTLTVWSEKFCLLSEFRTWLMLQHFLFITHALTHCLLSTSEVC